MSGPDYEIQIKIRNARLRRLIVAKGFKTAAEFCRAYGIRMQGISALLTMRLSPINPGSNDWSKLAMDVSAALTTDPEIIWPEHMRRRLEKNTYVIPISPDVELIAGDQNPEIAYQMKAAAGKLLAVLNDREREVIEARMKDVTLEELGKERGVSRERIRQHENKALRKMKEAARKQHIKPFEERPDAKKDWWEK
jgi:RNA polymerase sigma factor (sigma-70 family)